MTGTQSNNNAKKVCQYQLSIEYKAKCVQSRDFESHSKG